MRDKVKLLMQSRIVRLVCGESQMYFDAKSVVSMQTEDVYTFVSRNEDDSFEVVVLVVNDDEVHRWGSDQPVSIEAVSDEEDEMLKKAYKGEFTI